MPCPRPLVHLLILSSLLLSWALPASTAHAAPPFGDPVSRTGRLHVNWGDGRTGWSSIIVSISSEGEQDAHVLIDEALARRHGGLMALDRSHVTIHGRWAAADGVGHPAIRAERIEPAGGPPGPPSNASSVESVDSAAGPSGGSSASPAALSGSQPWVNLLCKFADVSTEPKPLSYFDGLVGEAAPGLGHYWREVSYDVINILGSGSSGWYTLPETRSYYLNLGTSGMLNALFADCTAAADPAVDFSPFVGINLMFNAELDGAAWGGSRYTTLDGVTRFWYTTWEPPWGYATSAVIAHEMGHGFGLPHSSGSYGQTYDNEWDIMSDSFANCSRSTDPTYGCLAQHTIAYHKDRLEWIPDAQLYEAVEVSQTVTLEQLALPKTGNYRMAVIPIGGSDTNYYTVEVRNWDGYDVKLPGQAVVIHQVDTARTRPAWVVDVDGDGDTGDEGAMWTVGETFEDAANDIRVSVDSASASGYTVTITLGDVPGPTATPAATATPTASSIPSPTATATSTPTQAPTATPTATETPAPSRTPTPTNSPTNTPTLTASPTPTATPSETPTNTPTASATYTPTSTETFTSTPTPTPTASETPQPTDTPLPPTATPTPEPTSTPLAPTATPSDTPEPTSTYTAVPTDTPGPTTTPEPTNTPAPTSTDTPAPTNTPSPPSTPMPPTTTPSYTPEPTSTLTQVPTDTPEPTNTPLPPTPTLTATPKPSNTPLPPTSTDTPEPTNTPLPPTPTSTQTPEPTSTPLPTKTHTPVSTETPTPTATGEATQTPPPPTGSPTATFTPTSEPQDEDVNQDGIVNVLDVQLCVNVILGIEIDPVFVARSDVNKDGMVNVLDVQAIVNALLLG